MSGFSSMDISASGLAAQRVRMDAIASNLANANSTRGANGPYRRQQVIFAPEFEEQWAGAVQPAGVSAEQVEDQSPSQVVYDPGHPDADPQGYVAMPNVSVVREMVDMVAATRAYEANVTAFNSAKAMATKALEIGRG